MQNSSPARVVPLQWNPIRQVFPNEARNFTPWLSEHLELLGDAIGVQDMELVSTEAPIGELRLDIRAAAYDDSGRQFAVAIESQYGSSDHDHLGKLVTYAAHAYDDPDVDHVISIWIVEVVREPHRAAVDFLNRTSPDDISYLIVSPKFAPGPAGGYYVHFDVVVRPNEFLRDIQLGRERQLNPDRVSFMAALHDSIEQTLLDLGFRGSWADPNGSMIRVYFPSNHPLTVWAELRILATQHNLRVVLSILNSAASTEESDRVLATIRTLHQDAVAAAIGNEMDWGSPGGNANRANAWARAEFAGLGYASRDVTGASAIALRFCEAVLAETRGDDPNQYPLPVGDTSASADRDLVTKIVELIQPGEWTTYGDISIAATGRSASAMAVGNILASVPDIPNPHRVLNKGGRIPAGWLVSDGSGPEECERRLIADGVPVVDGVADPDYYVPGAVLGNRLDMTPSTLPAEY